MTDLTRLSAAELAALNADLEERVRERTAELMAADGIYAQLFTLQASAYQSA